MHVPGQVLPPHDIAVDGHPRDGPKRPQHLDLLVAHRLGRERRRWFHRHQADQLQDVVLNDVPHGAGFFVVRAPIL
jgi:hypothetical protein